MARRERIQKVLAAQGIGSRRQVEGWIAAGRVTVNGATATPGEPVGPRDDVRLDGRRLRLHWDEPPQLAALAYHRPAREGIREAVAGTERSSLERLPAAPGGRWIAVSPMGLGEGGLELFVNEGGVAERLMRAADALRSEYSIRVRGDFDESRAEEILAAARRDRASRGSIEELECAGGEGVNRWARLVVTGLRPRDLRHLFELAGIEVNRVLRTRLGPVSLNRSLARGRYRRLSEAELAALLEAAGLGRAAPRPARASDRGRPAAGRRPRRRPSRR